MNNEGYESTLYEGPSNKVSDMERALASAQRTAALYGYSPESLKIREGITNPRDPARQATKKIVCSKDQAWTYC
ncbi:MAG: hypothetical protein QXM68_04350 [Candidatus Aenigmatarchaeota archaeon]|nr:hypothetical protein [Candidatus Aenigmarchaeota archaeon]